MSCHTHSRWGFAQRSLTLNLVLINLLVGIAAVAVADDDQDMPFSLQAVLTFDPHDFDAIPNGEYQHIRMRDADLDRMESHVGQPQLPAVARWFVLPPNRAVEGIEITPLDRFVVPGQYQPYPIMSEENALDAPPETPPWENIVYPKRTGCLVISGQARSFRLAKIAVYPLEYDAPRERITVLRAVNIRLRLRPLNTAEQRAGLVIRRPEAADDPFNSKREWIKSIAVNASDLDTFYPVYDMPRDDGTHGGRDTWMLEERIPYGSFVSEWPSEEGLSIPYVIITNDHDENGNEIAGMREAFQEWADTLTAFGMTAVVVTVDGIESNPDYDGFDRPMRIRNFIRSAVESWGTSYVLLGGDESVVPTRRIGGPSDSYNRPDPTADYWYTRFGKRTDDSAWEELWNGNQDSWIGENASDMYADSVHVFDTVWLGRLPARNKTEASGMVRKTMRYLLFPPYESDAADQSFYQAATVAAGPTHYTGLTNSNGIYYAEKKIVPRFDYDESPWSVKRLYPLVGTIRRECVPADTSDTSTVRCYGVLHSFIRDSCGLGPDPEEYWHGDDLRSTLNGNTHVLYHVEHSMRQFLGKASIGDDSDFHPANVPGCTNSTAIKEYCRKELKLDLHLDLEHLGINDALSLSNGAGTSAKYFFVFSHGSWTNMIDMDSVSEALIRSPEGGAVGYIGKSMTWGGKSVPEVYENTMTKLFDTREPARRFTQGWYEALHERYGGDQWFNDIRNACLHPVLGDPLMWPWRDVPVGMDFAVSPVGVGIVTVTVDVTEAGTQTPVGGALVCLRQGYWTYATAMTDDQGRAVFEGVLIQDVEKPVIVSGLKVGLKPSRTSFSVGGEQAFVGYLSHSIDDCGSGGDCDGVLEAGETVDIEVSLKNRGETASQMGFAVLRPTPLVTLDLKVNGSFRPSDTYLGQEKANPPTVADTFRIPLSNEGIRVEGEPVMMGTNQREIFRVWRVKSTGKYVIAADTYSESADSVFTGNLRCEAGFTDVAMTGELGDEFSCHGDSIWFQFHGDPTEDRITFRAEAPDWLSVQTSAAPIPALQPGDSTTASFSVSVNGDTPDRANLIFTTTAYQALITDVYFHTDFVTHVAKPRVDLVFIEKVLGDYGCSDTTWSWTPIILNRGSGCADSVALTLRKTAGKLSVLDSVVTFSVVEPDSFVANGDFLLCGKSVRDTTGFESVIRQETFYKEFPYEIAEYDDGGGGTYPGPEELRADLLAGTVLLGWKPMSYGDGYMIEWSHDPDCGPFEPIAHIGKEASRYEVRMPMTAPGHDGYGSAYYFSVRVCKHGVCGWRSTVGPVYPWVRERDGWPKLLPERSVCAPLVFDRSAWSLGYGKVIVAATDRIYAWNADGTPLNPDPGHEDGLFYDPGIQATGPDELFTEALAFGNWDKDTGFPELAGNFGLHGVHVVGIRESNDPSPQCCVSEVICKMDENSYLSPIVGKVLRPYQNTGAIFLSGAADGNIYAWDGRPPRGLRAACDGGIFAHCFDDTSAYNYQSLAVGYKTSGAPSERYDEIIAITKKGHLACFPTTDFGEVRDPRWSMDLTDSWLSTPAVGDVNGDGNNDIVVTSLWRYSGSQLVDGTIFMVDENTGTLLPHGTRSDPSWHFRRLGSDYPPAGPALADLDGDGDLEVILAGNTSGNIDGEEENPVSLTLHVFNYTEAGITDTSATASIPYGERNDEAGNVGGIYDGGALYAIGTPVVGDFDYNGAHWPDILVATNVGAIFAFTYHPETGELRPKPGWPLLLPDVPREPVLCDLGPSNGGQSLVVQCEDGWLHVFDLPKQNLDPPNPYWASYGGDPGNTRGVLSGRDRNDSDGSRTGNDGSRVTLDRIHPVPSSGVQMIELLSDRKEAIRLDVYDVGGRRIHTIHEGQIDPGMTSLRWNGRLANGGRVPSGIYWYRLYWSAGAETRRVVILQ